MVAGISRAASEEVLLLFSRRAQQRMAGGFIAEVGDEHGALLPGRLVDAIAGRAWK